MKGKDEDDVADGRGAEAGVQAEAEDVSKSEEDEGEAG